MINSAYFFEYGLEAGGIMRICLPHFETATGDLLGGLDVSFRAPCCPNLRACSGSCLRSRKPNTCCSTDNYYILAG
jgi:hypothetical protein